MNKLFRCVFNSRLDRFVATQVFNRTYERPLVELKAQPNLCPDSSDLSTRSDVIKLFLRNLRKYLRKGQWQFFAYIMAKSLLKIVHNIITLFILIYVHICVAAVKMYRIYVIFCFNQVQIFNRISLGVMTCFVYLLFLSQFAQTLS